jgi:site-specific DNA recombinase
MRKIAAKLEKKVIGYIRVSSTGQALDGESLERQEEQIRAYCLLKGLAEPEIISDAGVSGFKSNRDGFQQVVNLCKQKRVGVVIVYDLSRLSRSVRDTLEFIEDAIHKHGIEFVSLQNDIDTTTPMGKAFLGITAIFNQLYRDEISYKTKEALRHKTEKREKTGGLVPFGYSLVDGLKLCPKQGEFEVVREIHSLRRQGLSLRAIVEELNTRGVLTKTGKGKWHPQVIKQILERQIDEICLNSNLSNRQKDEALNEVTWALYQAEELTESRIAEVSVQ